MLDWLRKRLRAILKNRAWVGTALAGILLLAGWGGLANWYRDQLLAEKRTQLRADLEHEGYALTAAINRRVVLLPSLAAFSLSRPDELDRVEETDRAAAWLQQNVTGLDYLSLAPDGVQRYIFPAAGNESLRGVNLLGQPAVDRAIAVRQVTLGDVIQTPSGSARIVAYYAVYKDDQLWGLVTLGLNWQTILAEAALGENLPQIDLALRNDEGRTFYGDEAVLARDPVTYHLTGLPTGWVLAASPRTRWDALIEAAWRPFQAAGLLAVSLLTLLTFVALNRQARLVLAVQRSAAALRHAQDDLESRVKERTAELTLANAELNSEIAVRQRIAHQLRASEELYRTLITASPDAVIVAGQDGRMTFVSARAARMFGYEDPAELSGYPLLRGVIPADRPRARAKLRGLLDGQPSLDSDQFTLRRQDGRQFVGEVDSASLYNDAGQPYGVVSITRDLTRRLELQAALRRAHDELERRVAERTAELQQMNAALRESETRFRTVADFTYDWEYWLAPDGSLVYISPACERITGYPPSEFKREPGLLKRIIYADEAALVAEHIQQANEHGAAPPIDFRIIRRDGTLSWIAHVCRPVFDEQGQALGRRISNRDITERKAAENALREQEQLYRNVFDSVADGLAICALDGRVAEVNPAFCEMHGYAWGEIVGRPLTAFIHPLHRHVLADSVRAVKAGETWAAQAVHLRQDDQPFHVEARSVALTYYGQPHFLMVVRDASVQVEAYLRLEERVRERTHDLSRLLEFSHSMTRTLEMKPLLQLILNQLRSVVDYTGASIWSLTGQDLALAAQQGSDPAADARRPHIPIDSPLGRAVLDPLRPILIADARGDSPLARAFQATLGDLLDTTLGDSRAWLGIPLVITDHTVGLLAISHRQPNYFTQRHVDLALAFANQAVLAMENARLYEQAQDLAALQERQRLARDLHDSVSQTLFSASLAAQALPRLWERQPEEGRRCLAELGRLTSGALAEMRTLLVELRPNVLVETKLGDLLRQLAEAIISRTRVPVQVITNGLAPLPPEVQVTLYRIAQEALNNVAKHAGASQAVIRLQYFPRDRLDPTRSETAGEPALRVELSVSDDGCGFHQAGISADHLGLGIMRERAESIHATLRIESEIGGGTQVVVIWPQPQETNE